MPERNWSEKEILAVVREYLRMPDAQKAGKPINKAAVNRSLRKKELSGRTRGSIEFRMCNISTVIAEISYLQGYAPRQNVGNNVRTMIQDAFKNLGHK